MPLAAETATDTIFLIDQLLSYVAGTVGATLFFRYWLRGPRAHTHARVKFMQAMIALVWSLSGLCVVLLVMAGVPQPSPWVGGLIVLRCANGAFFPVSFLVLWQRPRGEASWHARLGPWLYRGTLLSASAVMLAYLVTWFRHWGVACVWPDRFLLLHLVATTLAGLCLLRREWLRDFATRFYVAMIALGVLLPTTLELLARTFNGPLTLVYLIGHQAPLLMMFGGMVYFRDFRFSNVFVKACLRFVLALWLSLGACLLVVLVIPPVIAPVTPFPRAGLLGAATLLVTALLCGFRWLAPKLDRLVDQWLYREPDYAAATRQCWTELAHEEDDAALMAHLAQSVRATLGLADARIVALSVLEAEPHAALLNSGELCALPSGEPLRERLGAEVEFLAPIRVGGQLTHVLALAPGAQRRNLLDSEANFVRGLVGQVSNRLDALAVERARRVQQSEEERLRRQITEAELRALRTQINPHFLFNSLNTIADLIVANPAQAERVTVQLAKIFRHVLRSSDCQMSAVREEIEFLKTWLDIEAVRFGDRLRVSFSVADELAAARVPSLILQPLVENALKHGLAPKLGGGTLQVAVARTGAQIRLTVEDDGLGFPRDPATTPANGHGIGLRNVAERLATLYAGRAQMLCETVATGGSRVTLLLPCES